MSQKLSAPSELMLLSSPIINSVKLKDNVTRQNRKCLRLRVSSETYLFFGLTSTFGFRSKSKKSLTRGFGSKTYFHITTQKKITKLPTRVTDEIEYKVSLRSISDDEMIQRY